MNDVNNTPTWKIETDDQQGAEDHTANPEDRYFYYRRCCQLRRNGQRCKAPAMKGESVCHNHFTQEEHRRFREQQRRSLLGELANRFGTPRDVARALSKISSELIAGHIDEKTAGRMFWEVQNIISR